MLAPVLNRERKSIYLEKLWFCYKRRNKKRQVHQKWDAELRLQPAAFSACNFSKTPAQMSSYEFCKILRTLTLQNIAKATSNDIIIIRFFCKVCCSLKWNMIKDNCFLKMSMYLFNKVNDHNTAILTCLDINPHLFLKKVEFF